jgi:hypothetical protein
MLCCPRILLIGLDLGEGGGEGQGGGEGVLRSLSVGILTSRRVRP